MKITKKYLQNLRACTSAIDFIEEQGLWDYKHLKIIGVFIKNKRYSDVIWWLTKIFDKKQNVNLAIFSARLVLPIFERAYPNDNRPRLAIDAAQNYLINPNAAYAAARAANAAYAAANAADAAYAAARAAYAAAYAAANAAYAAARAADAEANAANAAYAAARAADAEANANLKIIKYGLKLLREKKNG